MRKLINILVMMMIDDICKTKEPNDKHSSDGDIYKTNEKNDKHSACDDICKMLSTLLMMMEAGRREKGYIAKVLTCN